LIRTEHFDASLSRDQQDEFRVRGRLFLEVFETSWDAYEQNLVLAPLPPHQKVLSLNLWLPTNVGVRDEAQNSVRSQPAALVITSAHWQYTYEPSGNR
jgi:hypothetical protein